MKDCKDRIHIFEVKSVNVSGGMSIDSDEYKEKVKALKWFYTAVSKKTPHYYYLPIKNGGDWSIWLMKDGVIKEVSYDDFVEGVRD